MKKYLFIIAVALGIMVTGCKPEALKEYEDNSSFNPAALTGAWRITMAMQTDNDAVRKGFPYKTLELTDRLNLDEVVLTLTGSGSGTFTINYGTAPAIFKHTTGNWNLDDNSLPSLLRLINGTDTVKLNFANYASMASNKLMFRQKKVANGKDMITYDFEFTKQ